MKIISSKCLATVAVAAALTIGSSALAQEQITLKFAHPFPATHPLWTQAGQPFIDKITAATNGAVAFEVYHAGQLGKDYQTVLQSGLADIVILAAAYTPEKFPLTSAVDIPGNYGTSCEASAKFWNVLKQGGKLYDLEYKSFGIHPLFAVMPPPYKLMTTSRKIEKLADLSGLKLRAIGFAQSEAMRAIDAVPVQVPSSEIYESLSRGTIDGTIQSYIGVDTGNLRDSLKFAVGNLPVGSTGVSYSISEKSWDKLSDSLKEIVLKAGAEAQNEICSRYDTDEAALAQKFLAEGFTITELSEADVKAVNERLATVEQKWVDSMKAASKDGAAVLDAFKTGH
jgi:TRAP-type C4-dicarboxylate transport system substrate-binding protein